MNQHRPIRPCVKCGPCDQSRDRSDQSRDRSDQSRDREGAVLPPVAEDRFLIGAARNRFSDRLSRFVRALQCVFAIGILLLTGCHNLAKQTNKEKAAEHWNEVKGGFKSQLARQQYGERQYDKALLSATEAISLDPKKVDGYVVLARTQLELGRPASAQSTIDAARRLHLETAELSYLEGVILEQRDQFDPAIEKYRDARRADGSRVDFLIAEVGCLVATRRDDEALALLDESANRYNEDGELAALGGRLLAKRGDLSGAIARYRRALGELGESRWVARELGLLLVQARRHAEAVEVLRPLLDTRAGDARVDAPVRRALAECLLALGAPQDAKPLLVEYVQWQPADVVAQVLMAKAALATDDMLLAMNAVAAAQQSNPTHAELGLLRATIQWRRGELAAAETSLIEVLSRTPDDADAHCLMAEVLRAKRQTDRARTYFLRALELDPDCPWAKSGLGALRQDKAPDSDHDESAPRTKLTAAEVDRAP